MLLSVEETKAAWIKFNAARAEAGEGPLVPGLNLALFIASNALIGKTRRNGEDYMIHPLGVAMTGTMSNVKRIVGVLHDVVEDSGWTLEDLRDIGFSGEMVAGVDAVTKREGESYFAFIVRCGLGGEVAIDVKMRDLEYNSQGTECAGVYETIKQALKRQAYNISLHYLKAIRQGEISPGTPVPDFVNTHPEFGKDEQRTYIKEVLYPAFLDGTVKPSDKPMAQAFRATMAA